MLRNIVAVKRILYDALGHFNNDDGWAMSSHLAITALMALFPFLIFATTLASFLGARAFADTAVHIVFDTWPEQIAKPIAREVLNVLTVQRTDLLTYGVVLAAYFASNGIEALRTSLNRAYRVTETRGFFYRRAQSLVFVLIATAGFLTGTTIPSRDMLVRSATPPGSTGKVFGFVYAGLDLGAMLAPLVIGLALDRGHPQFAFAFMAGALGVTVLSAFVVKSEARRTAAAH